MCVVCTESVVNMQTCGKKFVCLSVNYVGAWRRGRICVYGSLNRL